jgi:hypothetical protein
VGIIIFILIIAFLLLLCGGALIRGVMSFWSDEPSYVHAYTMYIIAVLVSFQTHQFAFLDWGGLAFLASTYLIYSIGLYWKAWLEDGRLGLRGSLLTAVRGALLAAVHVTITFAVLSMLLVLSI